MVFCLLEKIQLLVFVVRSPYLQILHEPWLCSVGKWPYRTFFPLGPRLTIATFEGTTSTPHERSQSREKVSTSAVPSSTRCRLSRSHLLSQFEISKGLEVPKSWPRGPTTAHDQHPWLTTAPRPPWSRRNSTIPRLRDICLPCPQEVTAMAPANIARTDPDCPGALSVLRPPSRQPE